VPASCQLQRSKEDESHPSPVFRRGYVRTNHVRLLYAAKGTYNVDTYFEEIARLFHHIEPKNVSLNPVRAYNAQVYPDPTLTHANFVGQNRPFPTTGLQ
jgi:hypothetical protein